MAHFYVPRVDRRRISRWLPPLAWRTAGIIVAAYVVFTAAAAYPIYKANARNSFTDLAERLFPYPAAMVNGAAVPLAEFRRETEARHFYAVKHNLPSDEADIEAYVIRRLINRRAYEDALAANRILITEGDIDKRMDELVQEVGGEDKLTKFLRENYGDATGLAQFRTWVRDSLLEAAIRQQILARATVRHVLVALPENPTDKQVADGRAKALEIRGRIANAEQFAAVAQDYSEDVASRDKGGFLGTTTRGDEAPVHSQEFQDAIFSLPIGEISQPVRTPLGWHLVLVEKREGTVNASLTEYAAELRAAAKVKQYVAK